MSTATAEDIFKDATVVRDELGQAQLVRCIVPGKPLTWQRASRGKYGPSYTPKDRETQMSVIRDAWRDLDVEPFEREDALALGVVVFCKRPGPHFRADGSLKEWALRARPRGGEHGGDLDNFCKLVKDALQMVAYDDDTQVAEYLQPTAKFYAELGQMPRTVITLARAQEPPEAEMVLGGTLLG